jgi:hypothetical protein
MIGVDFYFLVLVLVCGGKNKQFAAVFKVNYFRIQHRIRRTGSVFLFENPSQSF